MPTTARAPHPALRGLVRPYVGYDVTGPPGVHHGHPDTTLTCVLSFDDPLDVSWGHRPETGVQHWSSVAGLHPGPALVHHGGAQRGVQLELTPAGARALLGLPAGALRGAVVGLADVVGPRADQAYDAVASAGSWDRRFDLLDAHLLGLLGLLGDRPGPRAEVARAWALLHRDPSTRVAALAGAVGWSRRHLTHAFDAEYGVGPKQAARLVRFQRSRALLGTGRRLAEVAVEAGYSDQAHLSRDWRDLAGQTPTAWLREELPFVQDEAGGLMTASRP